MLTKYIRRDIRRQGLINLKRRFYLNILVIFIASVIVNGGYQFATRTHVDTADETIRATNSVVVDAQKNGLFGLDNSVSNATIFVKFLANIFGFQMVENPQEISKTSTKYYSGVASVFVNEITGSQSFIFGILNGLNQLIFKGKVASSITIFIFSLLSIMLFLFVKNVIVVGKNRYYLEQRRYYETSASELLFPYKNKRLKNIAWVMFCRYILQVMWNLTIVGGFIKYYEYKLIPYIIAENPEIKMKDAFLISKEMMKGNKWRAFLIDFSLMPWRILSFFTYNLSGVFFSDAYTECVGAETYMRIRELKREELSARLRELLNDDMLAIDHVEETEHPSGVEVLDIPKVSVRTLKHNYMRDYSFLSIVELFFTYSLVGWLWEVIFYLASTGQFVNRGTMHGPWLPIYGCGGLLIIVLLKPFREKPWMLFFGTVIVCGGVEYFTSWILEKMFNQRWWDYTGYFMNLNGRICLEGLLVFGMAGFAFTYVISPMLDDYYKKMQDKHRKILCIALMALFVADIVWSFMAPNIGEGITSGLV